VAELKASNSNPSFDFDSEIEKGKQIIDVEPNVTITTTKFYPKELEDPKQGERLFHS
jgi:hypothetical protein